MTFHEPPMILSPKIEKDIDIYCDDLSFPDQNSSSISSPDDNFTEHDLVDITLSPSGRTSPRPPKPPNKILKSQQYTFKDDNIEEYNPSEITELEKKLMKTKIQLEEKIKELNQNIDAEQEKCKIEIKTAIEEMKTESQNEFKNVTKPEMLEIKSLGTVVKATVKSPHGKSEHSNPFSEKHNIIVQKQKEQVLELNTKYTEKMNALRQQSEAQIKPLQREISKINSQLRHIYKLEEIQDEEIQCVFPLSPTCSPTGFGGAFSLKRCNSALTLVRIPK
ncbi:hypothetical protein GPJ56_006397 [Histomonas meleagridis]|uniref:uncharacterized protein n=1 Tax=Histomonas meleagridis TaxID=135588 RepID=UPI00355AAF50|nr:hypothetical protein GPJ56_006397 [Histomonas meleagridis]KAH0796787.1 hypothetical protein GO595_010680 [Histomonas meleagridis]